MDFWSSLLVQEVLSSDVTVLATELWLLWDRPERYRYSAFVGVGVYEFKGEHLFITIELIWNLLPSEKVVTL